jgi:hypothetical protein
LNRLFNVMTDFFGHTIVQLLILLLYLLVLVVCTPVADESQKCQNNYQHKNSFRCSHTMVRKLLKRCPRLNVNDVLLLWTVVEEIFHKLGDL